MSQDFETPKPTPPETPSPESRGAGPRLNTPAPPDRPRGDPEHGSPHRRLSTMVGVNFLLTLGTILGLAWMILRPPGAQPTTAAQPEETKALSSEVDRLKGEVAGLAKKLGVMAAPADPTPQIKSLDEKVAELGKTLAETPARIDALSQKVEAATKSEASGSAPKVDAIDKKVGELAQAIDALKAEIATRGTPASVTATNSPIANAEGPAMAQAADLFQQGKYAEAKDAFGKLQSSAPDDARVWYFSALTTGLTSRDWKGESERLVKLGVEKEKAGTPARDQIDATFANLTVNNGKAWLAYYRNQAR